MSCITIMTVNYGQPIACKGKAKADSPLPLSEGSNQEVHDVTVIQEEGIYSLLQAEDKDQVCNL